MEEYKISVIVPIYCVEKYLQRCVDSILRQSYKNLEIILVDDGSPDRCGEICEEYRKRDSRIRVIHQENKGLSEARNAGIDMATGRYISFIDSDDYIMENMIEILYRNLQDYHAQISCCGHMDVYEGSNRTVIPKPRDIIVLTPQEALSRFLLTKVVDVISCNKLFDIELFKNRRFVPGKLYEDHFLIYQILDAADRIVDCSTPLYCYCKRSTSISGADYSPKMLMLKEALNIECSYIKKKYPSIAKQVDLGYVRWLVVIYNKMILSNQEDPTLLRLIKERVICILPQIMIHPDIESIQKIQMILLLMNRRLYGCLYRSYIRRQR